MTGMNRQQKELQKIISKGKVYASTVGQLIAGMGVQLGTIPVQPELSMKSLRAIADNFRKVANELDDDMDTLEEWIESAKQRIVGVEKGPITDLEGNPIA